MGVLEKTRLSGANSDRTLRKRLNRAPHLRWWLIYGPARCGTTLLFRMLAANARLQISDWGLGPVLQGPPEQDRIPLDRPRLWADVCANAIDNARRGTGTTLDVAYKSAEMRLHEYTALCHVWGEPERRILCFRAPDSYISSAVEKFPHRSLAELQQSYIDSLNEYSRIGGEAFEYHPGLSNADYDALIAPLEAPDDARTTFRYSGNTAAELVTDAMQLAYEQLRESLNHTQAPSNAVSRGITGA